MRLDGGGDQFRRMVVRELRGDEVVRSTGRDWDAHAPPVTMAAGEAASDMDARAPAVPSWDPARRAVEIRKGGVALSSAGAIRQQLPAVRTGCETLVAGPQASHPSARASFAIEHSIRAACAGSA